MADRPAARAGDARREVGRRQRPAGAEHRRRAAAPTRRSGRWPSRPSCTSLFPLLLLMVRRCSAPRDGRQRSRSSWRRWGSSARTSPRLDTFVIQSAPDLAALFAVGILSRRHRRGERGPQVVAVGWLALAAAAPVLATIWWQGSVWTLDQPVLGRPRAGPGDRVPAGRARHRPSGAAPARARRAADPQPRLVVLQPVPDPRADRRRRLRAARGRPVRQGVPAFVVSLALVLPLTIVFARLFASVFETPVPAAAHLVPARPGGGILDAEGVPA